MQVNFDQPVPLAYAAEIATRFGSMSIDPAPVEVRCDHSYSWSNAVGTYYIQWACGASTAPWGFELTADAQSVVDGGVSERGMAWTLNGLRQPQQAPHLDVYAGYTWHGNYNGLSDGSKVTYQDELTFRHSLGTGGTVTVTLSGQHTLSNEPW